MLFEAAKWLVQLCIVCEPRLKYDGMMFSPDAITGQNTPIIACYDPVLSPSETVPVATYDKLQIF